MTELHFLPAAGGDFLWLRFGTSADKMHNIIIDSGYRSCFLDFNAVLRSLVRAKETIDAIVLTHTDDDHIGGFLCWLESSSAENASIERIYFNTGRGISEHVGGGRKAQKNYFENSIQGTPSNGNYSVRSACSILELLHKKSYWIGFALTAWQAIRPLRCPAAHRCALSVPLKKPRWNLENCGARWKRKRLSIMGAREKTTAHGMIWTH